MKDNPISILIMISLAAGLLLGACRGPEPEPQSLTAEGEYSSAGEPAGAGDDLDAYDYDDEGTSLEGVKACELLPLAEVAAITGPLREDETSEELSIAGEAGCKFIDQQGHFYVLTYYPLLEWGVAEFTLNEVEALEGLLDGAWMGTYSGGEITVKALAEGELVIGVHLSTGELEAARSLVELAFQHRPLP